MTTTVREEGSTTPPSPLTLQAEGQVSNRRREKDIAELHRTIETLFHEIYTLDETERTSTISITENIKKLARNFEEIMLQEKQPEFICTICSLILKRFRDDKRPWLRTYATRVLDDKYKRYHTEDSYRQSVHQSTDQLEECSVEENMAIAQVTLLRDKFNYNQFSKKGIQKFNDICVDIVSKVSNFASQNGIAVYNVHDNSSAMDETNDNADKAYEDKISEEPLPLSMDAAIRQVDAEAYEETMKVIEAIKTWANKQRDYSRSQTLEQAIKWRDSMHAFRIIVEQLNDGKARRSLDQWGQILKDLAEHGGTAASSKSTLPIIDPVTGKQLVDPKTCKPLFRGITKEQIDARGPKYATDIDFVVRQFVVTDMMRWRYMLLTRSQRDKRADKASPKLSRQA